MLALCYQRDVATCRNIIDILEARTLLETCGNQCYKFKAIVKAAFRKFKGVKCASKSEFLVKFLERL